MANENETVEAVIHSARESISMLKKRSEAGDPYKIDTAFLVKTITDRFESAWRREKFVSREVAELRECLHQAVESRCGNCFAFNRTCDGRTKNTKHCPRLGFRDGKVKRLSDECKVLRWRKALEGDAK